MDSYVNSSNFPKTASLALVSGQQKTSGYSLIKGRWFK